MNFQKGEANTKILITILVILIIIMEGILAYKSIQNKENATVFVSSEDNSSISTNILFKKKLGADGDSLTALCDDDITYTQQISDNNNMSNLNNIAMGGATIATGTIYKETGKNRHWISQSVLNLNEDNDYILIGGGINDYWNNVPLGSNTENMTDTIDSNTFYGGLELLCRNLLDKFTTGQKIGFVINHKINDTFKSKNSIGLTFNDYYQAIKIVLYKYSIPFIDLSKDSCFNTELPIYKQYTKNNHDGVHPTTTGYKLFYVDKITAFLKSL